MDSPFVDKILLFSKNFDSVVYKLGSSMKKLPLKSHNFEKFVS